MQTFLPYPDFAESAACLDYKRLGKQRVETMQIYNAMNTPGAAWYSHPMCRMWRPYPIALLYYGKVITLEWISRGYNDKMLDWFNNVLSKEYTGFPFSAVQMKFYLEQIEWLGNDRLHSSHRAALLWKHLSYYQQYGWTEEPKLEYYWPI